MMPTALARITAFWDTTPGRCWPGQGITLHCGGTWYLSPFGWKAWTEFATGVVGRVGLVER